MSVRQAKTLKLPIQEDDLRQSGVFESARKCRSVDPGRNTVVLGVDSALRANGASEHLRVPATARHEIGDAHAGLDAHQCEHFRWPAVGVSRSVDFGPFGMGQSFSSRSGRIGARGRW
jgi:hypothetical protein